MITRANCAGAQQDTQDMLGSRVGPLVLALAQADINPPKPQGIRGCTRPHQVAVNYPQTFFLDMNKAVGNMAALLASTMLPSRTLRSFSKGRIWQDRKGEMQIFFL